MRNKLVIFLILLIFLLVAKERPKKKKKPAYNEQILNIEKGSILEKNFLIFKLNNKFGIMTQDGEIVKNNNYDQVINLDEKIYLLLKDKEITAYNIKRNKVFNVDGMSRIGENLYKIFKNNKYGMVDSEFDVVIEPVNDKIESNREWSLVENKGDFKIINNTTGMTAVDMVNSFQQVRLGVGKMIYFKKDNKWGIINSDKEIVEAKYDELMNLNDKNLVIGYIGNENYLINTDKNIEKKMEYENYSKESENTIMVMKGNKIGYIDNNGKEIISLKYDGGFSFSKNRDFIQLKEDGKWKLLNLKTKEEKELSYSDIGEYIDGYMVVEKNEKYGYIDEKGKVKIPFKYSIAENFKDGLGVVASTNGYGIIDKKGQEIIPLIYDEVFIDKGYIYGVKNKKIGLFNREGEVILPLEYSYLSRVESERVLFEKDKKLGIIKLNKEKNGD